LIVELEHPAIGITRSIANPIRLSATPMVYRLPPPLLGEHTHEIMASLGYSPQEIDTAEGAKAVSPSPREFKQLLSYRFRVSQRFGYVCCKPNAIPGCRVTSEKRSGLAAKPTYYHSVTLRDPYLTQILFWDLPEVQEKNGSSGRTRTYNPPVNSRMLCH
jgi:hypothetical protein